MVGVWTYIRAKLTAFTEKNIQVRQCHNGLLLANGHKYALLQASNPDPLCISQAAAGSILSFWDIFRNSTELTVAVFNAFNSVTFQRYLDLD